jgi:arylsulfatase A-like enzyme
VLNIDFAPTILDLAELPVPSSIQGRSVVPLARGENVGDWRKSFLYEYYEYPGVHCARKNRGVRTQQWKYIHFWEQPEEFELYDLKNDPDETHNLVKNSSYKNVLEEMKGRLAQLRQETSDIELPNTDPGPCEFGFGGRVNPAAPQ